MALSLAQQSKELGSLALLHRSGSRLIPEPIVFPPYLTGAKFLDRALVPQAEVAGLTLLPDRFNTQSKGECLSCRCTGGVASLIGAWSGGLELSQVI